MTHTFAGARVASVEPPSDQEAVQLLRDLVAIPSPSGREGQGVRRFVEGAGGWGFATSVDEAGNGIAWRVASEPSQSDRHLVLLGHLDTVPGLIPVRVEDGVLFGRGSVDAKGPLVAMLAAAARARLPEGVRVWVVAAVGEETAHSPGARHLARRLRPDACIIGEPSHTHGVTLGYKGRLVLRIGALRECAHGAGPIGSASDAALAEWRRIGDVVRGVNIGHERSFDVVQIRVIEMHAESDGLSDRASLLVGFRLPLWMTPDELQRRIERDASSGEGVTLAFSGHELAHASPRNDLVARSIVGAIRAHGMTPRPLLKTGTSDMNVVAPAWRCPIAAYGPGDSNLDHTPGERLCLREFLRAVGVLADAIEAIAAELASAER